MHRTTYFIIALTMFTTMMNAQTPLIDRDLFFGNAEISGGQISPDGNWISFMKEYEGILNVWVKKIDEPFNAAKPLTDSKRPMYGYFWTNDSKYILFVKDKDGDENINVFAVDPSDAFKNNSIPQSRNLTPLKDVTAQIYKVSEKKPDIMYVGLNDRDKAWHDLYKLTISSGKLELLFENNDRTTGYDFDWDDNLRGYYRTDEKGNTAYMYINSDNTTTKLFETTVSESAYITSWNEDNSKFYLVSNVGDLDKSTLFLMDPKTKEKTFIESDPKNKVDLGEVRFNQLTRKMIATSYTMDKTMYYWKDKNWAKMYKFLSKKFPGREVTFSSSNKDYTKFLIAVYGDKYVTEVYSYEPKNKKLVFQYTPRPKLKSIEKHLSEMQPISYKSSDGLEIPAYLSVPSGSEAKNLPLVVLVHGGPKGPRDYWGYNAEVQFLTNRGYAVLQPNFRASGGFGKKFLNAGDKQWGKLMQDDITWGVKHLINKGIVDKNKVAIMGGSYGGYATLAGLAFTPEMYACGVDIVGPSNIFTLLESIPPYWEAGRAFLYGMVGDPNTDEGQKLIRDASPLFSADKINKPLLIIQGANDPRVKQAEADQIVIALREKGKQVVYLLAEDEGHGFAKPLNKKAMYAKTEEFLSGVLGGRFQADMEKDVKETLNRLTVDINTVVYNPLGNIELATTLPEIQPHFKEQEVEYDVAIEVAGQKIPMTIKRKIKQDAGNWVITDASSSPMGESEDQAVYSASLTPISRNLKQMGMDIPVTYKENKVVVSMGGNDSEIELQGAVLPDGPGTDVIIAGMPLADGFVLNLNVPDMMTMKAKKVTLTYLGTEDMNGIQYQKVSIVGHENKKDEITYWINPNTKMADKVVQIIPAMQNAKMTMTKK